MQFLQTFHTDFEKILKCPVCGEEFAISENCKSLVCKGIKTHCFDISKKGYVNLLCSQSGKGDSKEAVRSRTAFLEKDFYLPFAKGICDIISEYSDNKKITVIDAGCGEGYYTNLVAQECNCRVLGFDLSKYGVEYASSYAKRMDIHNSLFSVAGIFDMPVKDNCADVVMNLFAPCAEDEFKRVLKKGGMLIVAGAGKDHLYGLKKAIYETPYKNEVRNDLPRSMEHVDSKVIKFNIRLPDFQDRNNLFAMTPYFYRTSKNDAQKLENACNLETEVEFNIEIYRA